MILAGIQQGNAARVVEDNAGSGLKVATKILGRASISVMAEFTAGSVLANADRLVCWRSIGKRRNSGEG